VLVGVPVVLIVVFAVRRAAIDVPNLASGAVPDSPTDVAFASHPGLAYAHIIPSLGYLLGAPLQLSRRFRTTDYDRHRRLGRILIASAALGTVFSVIFGLGFAVGGGAEAAAGVIFGTYMICCLAFAIRAIRRADVAGHRRWMIRAFIITIAVGTVRLWVMVLWGSGLMSIEAAFGVGFWAAFLLHLVAAEAWQRRNPAP